MLGKIAAAANIAGSVFGGIGAMQQAKATRRAAERGQKDVRDFTKAQIEKSDALGKEKQTYLEGGDPFTDMGRFIFGDAGSSTYANLRKSQSDFARLAAGDTSGFQKEVASMVANSLANTFGGPRGSFENLSAKNLLNFRQLGANTAMSLTDYFGRTGQQLIGNKFGILDQTFDRQMKLREYETNAVNQLRMQAAGTAGAGMAALGNVANAVGGGLNSFNMMQQNQQALTSQQNYQNRYLNYLLSSIGQNENRPQSNGAGYSPIPSNLGDPPQDPLPQESPATMTYLSGRTAPFGGWMSSRRRVGFNDDTLEPSLFPPP
jgi:hypothetical protein